MYNTRDDGIMLADERSISIRENYLQNLKNPAWVKRVHKFPERMSCLNESSTPTPEDLHLREAHRHDCEVTGGNLGITATLRYIRRLQPNRLTLDFQKVDDMEFGSRFYKQEINRCDVDML